MNIHEFIVNIPEWIDAKEPEQFIDELKSIYLRDDKNLTNAYARGTNRFFRIKIQPVKSFRGWVRKQHILRLLDIMNKSHKPELLKPKDKVVLKKQIRKADKSMSAKATGVSGTQASASTWTR
ncbi:MAG: hypothetical protein GY928_08200 [Colwellia sp.]|nr:hypothetical protein [Colwellia sp.]